MSSSHNFHIHGEQPTVVFYDGCEIGALRVLSDSLDTDITVFCWEVPKDKLQRAIEAFNLEMQREPVAQQIAAE